MEGKPWNACHHATSCDRQPSAVECSRFNSEYIQMHIFFDYIHYSIQYLSSILHYYTLKSVRICEVGCLTGLLTTRQMVMDLDTKESNVSSAKIHQIQPPWTFTVPTTERLSWGLALSSTSLMSSKKASISSFSCRQSK